MSTFKQQVEEGKKLCSKLGLKIKSITELDSLLTLYLQDGTTLTVNLENPDFTSKIKKTSERIGRLIEQGKRTRKTQYSAPKNDTTEIDKLQTTETPSDQLYTYKAEFVENFDGDTLTFRIDLGFGSKLLQQVTLKGLNAPEMTGKTKAAGEASKKWVNEKLSKAKAIIIKSHQKPKGGYTRYAVDIFADDKDFAIEMVEAGHATAVT